MIKCRPSLIYIVYTIYRSIIIISFCCLDMSFCILLPLIISTLSEVQCFSLIAYPHHVSIQFQVYLIFISKLSRGLLYLHQTLSSLRIKRGMVILYYLVKIDKNSVSYKETYLLKEMKIQFEAAVTLWLKILIYF